MIVDFIIKMTLMQHGIMIQAVKFDLANECICIDYTQELKPGKKSIPFREIEELFNNGAQKPSAGPPGPPRIEEQGSGGPDTHTP